MLKATGPASRMKGEGSMNMNERVRELRALRQMANELAAEIEAIESEVKAEMSARNVDTLTGTDWRITWKSVTSSRLDTAALKRELPELAERFTRQTTVRRFVVA